MKSLIGIDVGTQSLRACVFRSDGQLLAKKVVSFRSTKYPAPTYAEQDPVEWWNAALVALKTIVSHPDVDPNEIIALSYACTSCTVVFLDEDDKPVRPAMLWMDSRSVEEAKKVQATNSPVLPFSGGVESAEWMLPKILWVKEHEPQHYLRSTHIVEQIDYFTRKLTGIWTLGYNHLVAKWNYANPVGGWPDGFLEELGLEDVKQKWPETVLPIGSLVGTIAPLLAKEIGLHEEVKVIQGGMDSTAGMLGLGAFDVGQIGLSHGTSTVLQCQSDRYMNGFKGRPDALVKGLYLIGGGEPTTGATAQWWISLLAEESKIKYDDYYAFLENKVAGLNPGSSGLIALEHFQGSRSLNDPDCRGMIWGLTLWHTSAHILRAIYEGISYGVRRFIEQLESNGYQITRISAGGGLIQSDVCAQILSDVCGLSLTKVSEREQTALGSAIIAGVGAGIFPDYPSGIQSMVHFTQPIAPNEKNHEIYNFYYQKYCQTYDAMKDLMHDVVSFEKSRKPVN